jgi:hypothetical protein
LANEGEGADEGCKVLLRCQASDAQKEGRTPIGEPRMSRGLFQTAPEAGVDDRVVDRPGLLRGTSGTPLRSSASPWETVITPFARRMTERQARTWRRLFASDQPTISRDLDLETTMRWVVGQVDGDDRATTVRECIAAMSKAACRGCSFIGTGVARKRFASRRGNGYGISATPYNHSGIKSLAAAIAVPLNPALSRRARETLSALHPTFAVNCPAYFCGRPSPPHPECPRNTGDKHPVRPQRPLRFHRKP